MFADVFAGDATLLDDLERGHRYPAARCAALAGLGRKEAQPILHERERTRWRRQALTWLRADLALWTKRWLGSVSPSS